VSRAAELEEVAALATTCIQGARRIVQGLAPISDADGSLEAALAGPARQLPERLDGQLSRPRRCASVDRTRHAQSPVSHCSGGRPKRVEDRARGLGLGMRTMRFRANSIGARLMIGQGNGGGFSVVCELPHVHDRRVTA
jgi:signal transduction histidine kinase